MVSLNWQWGDLCRHERGLCTQEDRNSIVVDTISVESSDSSPPTGEEMCLL